MYVAASKSGDKPDTTLSTPAIVKLKYSGTTYQEERRYELGVNFSGISSMGPAKDASGNDGTRFLLKAGDAVYEAIIPYDNSKSVLPPQFKFSIDRSGTFYSNYASQGLYYDIDTDKMYVNYFGYNRDSTGNVISARANANVILVYKNVKNALANSTRPPLDKAAIEIVKGNDINVLFEIESCGFPRGRTPTSENNVFWFNTNEGTITPSIKVNGGIYAETRAVK
jgi:hypothetical protein